MRRKVHTGQYIERRILVLLAGLLIAFLILYSYLVSQSIVNVLVRQDIGAEIATLNSRISSLESEYLVRKERINLSYAYTLGYIDIGNKEFVTRKSLLSRGLTVNDEI